MTPNATVHSPIPDPVPRHASDRELVGQIISGDHLAWRTFVVGYQRLVRSRVADVASAFSRGEDDSAIDDATAEVFAALVGHESAPLRAYHGRSSLATYIAVLSTRSATRSFARNRLVVHGDHDARHSQHHDDNHEDHVARFIRADQHHHIQSLIDQLPANQRSVVSLFHLQGLSYAQISQKLEMPIGAIGPILRQAETRLRQLMEASNS